MEVSTTDGASGIELTKDAVQLIKEIVNLDSAQRKAKIPLFQRLYDMWKHNLLTAAKAKKQFEQNRQFIKELIYNNFTEKERNDMELAKNIHQNISNGFSYTTAANVIIPSNKAEIQKYKTILHNSNLRVNNRFDSLYNEFLEYINSISNNNTSDSNLFVPLELPVATRDTLDRAAKEKARIEGYAGLSVTNPEGKNRKKGKGNNADDSDESSQSDEVIVYRNYR